MPSVSAAFTAPVVNPVPAVPAAPAKEDAKAACPAAAASAAVAPAASAASLAAAEAEYAESCGARYGAATTKAIAPTVIQPPGITSPTALSKDAPALPMAGPGSTLANTLLTLLTAWLTLCPALSYTLPGLNGLNFPQPIIWTPLKLPSNYTRECLIFAHLNLRHPKNQTPALKQGCDFFQRIRKLWLFLNS